LAIIFYPCHGLLRCVSLGLKNIRNPTDESDINEKTSAVYESPVIVKKEK
jgi:hypothetical protein